MFPTTYPYGPLEFGSKLFLQIPNSGFQLLRVDYKRQTYIYICFSLITPNPDTMQIQYNSLAMYFQYIDGFNIFNMRTYAHIYN